MPLTTTSAGLCSVSLRALPHGAVVTAAAAAGLAALEWGGDVHVPPGDTATARAVGAATRDAGLRVASYGSYHRALDPAAFDDVLAAAVALGAPRIRVWAGRTASAQAGAEDRAQVARGVADAVRRAGDAGVEIGLEWHGGTLTDTAASTAGLLAAVDDLVGAQTLTTYWQPALDTGADEVLAGLAALADRVSTVHVFSWWPGTVRNTLASREDLWERVFALLGGTARDHDALLEFLPGDDPDHLAGEARTLLGWLSPRSPRHLHVRRPAVPPKPPG